MTCSVIELSGEIIEKTISSMNQFNDLKGCYIKVMLL